MITRFLSILAAGVLSVALSASAAQAQTVCDALDQVNRVRVARGLYPLQRNPVLQAAAEMESVIRAKRRRTGHLPNGVSPGRAEGVGWRGNRDPYGENFLTCFHAPRDYTRRYREAGAAVAVCPRGRTYYTLILK